MGEPIYRDSKIEITEELIRVGTSTYAVPAINTVMVEPPPSLVFAAIWAVIDIGLVFSGLLLMAVGLLLFGLIMLGFAAYCVWYTSRVLRRLHTLKIAMSSGKATVLRDRSDEYLAKIGSEILTAMRAARAAKPDADDQPVARDGDTMFCPECAETIKAAAKICRFCRHRLVPADN